MRSQSNKPPSGRQDLLTSETSFNMIQSFRRDDVMSKSVFSSNRPLKSLTNRTMAANKVR